MHGISNNDNNEDGETWTKPFRLRSAIRLFFSPVCVCVCFLFLFITHQITARLFRKQWTEPNFNTFMNLDRYYSKHAWFCCCNAKHSSASEIPETLFNIWLPKTLNAVRRCGPCTLHVSCDSHFHRTRH